MKTAVVQLDYSTYYTDQIHVLVKGNKVSSQDAAQSFVSSSPYLYSLSLSETGVKDTEWSFRKSYGKQINKTEATEFISS